MYVYLLFHLRHRLGNCEVNLYETQFECFRRRVLEFAKLKEWTQSRKNIDLRAGERNGEKDKGLLKDQGYGVLWYTTTTSMVPCVCYWVLQVDTGIWEGMPGIKAVKEFSLFWVLYNFVMNCWVFTRWSSFTSFIQFFLLKNTRTNFLELSIVSLKLLPIDFNFTIKCNLMGLIRWCATTNQF